MHWGLQLAGAAKVVIAVLVLFASLEAALGFCAGCYVMVVSDLPWIVRVLADLNVARPWNLVILFLDIR